MEEVKVFKEAKEILEQKQIGHECEYIYDSRYQMISKGYAEAVRTQNWKKAHDLLRNIHMVEERFHSGLWTKNGSWT